MKNPQKKIFFFLQGKTVEEALFARRGLKSVHRRAGIALNNAPRKN
jgi:hypothetical protein